jgi:alpha-L-fucosidase 2
MKARGNFTVDFKWKDGKIINYRISSPNPRKVRLKINGELKTITAEKA